MFDAKETTREKLTFAYDLAVNVPITKNGKEKRHRIYNRNSQAKF